MAVALRHLLLGLLVLGPLSSVWGAPKVLTYSSRSVFVEASDDQGAEAHELAEMQCQKNGLHAYNTGRPDGPKGSYIFFACAAAPIWEVIAKNRVLMIRAPRSAAAEVDRFAQDECVKQGATSARRTAPPSDVFPYQIFSCKD